MCNRAWVTAIKHIWIYQTIPVAARHPVSTESKLLMLLLLDTFLTWGRDRWLQSSKDIPPKYCTMQLQPNKHNVKHWGKNGNKKPEWDAIRSWCTNAEPLHGLNCCPVYETLVVSMPIATSNISYLTSYLIRYVMTNQNGYFIVKSKLLLVINRIHISV